MLRELASKKTCKECEYEWAIKSERREPDNKRNWSKLYKSGGGWESW